MIACDVTICGAGISGLLMASELSKSSSVAVLERSDRSRCSNKFWLTTKQSLESNPEFSACIDSEWDSMDFVSYNRAKFTAKGSYVLWNTKKLEEQLVDNIHRNGSTVHYGHRFYSYRVTSRSIQSHANTRSFESKLLIDCMGYASPIVSSTNAVSILGYHHLYGRTMALKSHVNPVAADNVLISGTPSYLELFPKSNGTANVVLIAPSKGVRSLAELQNDFDFIVSGTHYAEVLSPLNDGDALHGIVPIGRTRKRALDRVLFYGEAGQIHPAASCTCLNKLLLDHKETARRIKQSIDADCVSAASLSDLVPRISGFSQRFNQNLFRLMSQLTSHEGDSFIELLECLDQKSINDLLFGEIRPTHFLQLQNFMKILKARNTLWIKPLLRTAFNL
jgi:2-polyprenyl-6-methoxyphenol hydroxylase-like FAD-dependent oxidoreductase